MKRTKTILAFAGLACAYLCAASAYADPSKVVIGDIDDMSGPYADVIGPHGVEAAKMAIADFGGTVLGRPIELLTADHQNKPALGVAEIPRVGRRERPQHADRRLQYRRQSRHQRRGQGKEGPLHLHRRRWRFADRQGLHALHHPLRLRHHRARQRHGENHSQPRAARAGSSSPPTTPSARSCRTPRPTSSRRAAARWPARCACRSAPPTSPPTCCRRRARARRSSASPTPAPTPPIR